MRNYIIYILLVLFGAFFFFEGAKADGICDDYYTDQNSCIISGHPSPYDMARLVGQSEEYYHKYALLIEPNHFIGGGNSYHLIYALYLIAERIGDERAVEPKKVMTRLLDRASIDEINTMVFCKYSIDYLNKCFASNSMLTGEPINKTYPLYMDQ